MKLYATLVIEEVWDIGKSQGRSMVPAVRVIPHDEEGKKPRGKAGKGLLLIAKEGESHADVLRSAAAYLEQEEGDWSAFDKEKMTQ